ncbi:SAV_915 family protein [Actinomadura adrarensis]|uniref:SAV_915 family protein n=1 Tax=Actinomadura adrarensis TaxID=1819600 RepID=A0ABW3CRX8_9ACTN
MTPPNDRVYDDRRWFEPDDPTAPDVITSEREDTAPALGDMVYVPTEAEVSREDENATLKLATTTSGERAALAYSSLEHLVRCCGDQHPWVAFRTERIDALPDITGADVLLWDEELPPELRRESEQRPPREQ